MEVVAVKKAGIESITVTLTLEEAQLLVNTHHYHIAGQPIGFRGVFDDIVKPLRESGIQVTRDPARGTGDICYPTSKSDCE